MDILTSIRSSFADEYGDARRLFLGAATAAGAGLTAWENPLRGPQGEPLTTDVAWVGPEDAGRRLNVDYVASGSVRRPLGGRVVVTVELVEARTARIVWTEAFEHKPDDAFLVLDEIGNRIVSSIASEIEMVERNRAILKPHEPHAGLDRALPLDLCPHLRPSQGVVVPGGFEARHRANRVLLDGSDVHRSRVVRVGLVGPHEPREEHEGERAGGERCEEEQVASHGHGAPRSVATCT